MKKKFFLICGENSKIKIQQRKFEDKIPNKNSTEKKFRNKFQRQKFIQRNFKLKSLKNIPAFLQHFFKKHFLRNISKLIRGRKIISRLKWKNVQEKIRKKNRRRNSMDKKLHGEILVNRNLKVNLFFKKYSWHFLKLILEKIFQI